ncbi:unnamed protein product [Dovyalis caffra]|uniref:Uncharacterized protein n=1 Tax=Dovyalis caffra TaxID=77055 RepID=A0AAV1SBN9_9ROSI|nr:unnamed protein product [Dovyalis caffra]
MVEIARENKVPLIHFSVFSTATYVFLGSPEYLVGDGQKRLRPSWMSMTSKPEWVDFPSSISYRNHKAVGAFKGMYGGNASGITDGERVSKILDGCQAFAVRSCTEFEGDYLTLFERLIGRPVIPVGLLPPEKPERREITDALGTYESIGIHAGFHSENASSTTDAARLAKVLDSCQASFIINQTFNARLFLEKGLAIEVKISKGGSFSQVSDYLRQAMIGQEKAAPNQDFQLLKLVTLTDGQTALASAKTPANQRDLVMASDLHVVVAFGSYEARNIYPGIFGENASGIRDAERAAKTFKWMSSYN